MNRQDKRELLALSAYQLALLLLELRNFVAERETAYMLGASDFIDNHGLEPNSPDAELALSFYQEAAAANLETELAEVAKRYTEIFTREELLVLVFLHRHPAMQRLLASDEDDIEMLMEESNSQIEDETLKRMRQNNVNLDGVGEKGLELWEPPKTEWKM